MRFFACLIAFSLITSPAMAAHSKAPKKAATEGSKERAPSSNNSFRVANFSCRAEDGTTSALGLVHLGIDLKNNDTGFFGLTLYAKVDKNSVATKVLNGAYTTVPSGYVLQAQWPGAANDQVVIYLHQGDRTVIPGIAGKLVCAVVSQMEQI